MKARTAVTINILCGIGKMLVTGFFIFGVVWLMLTYGTDSNTITVDSVVNDPGDVLMFSILAGLVFSPVRLIGKLPFSELQIMYLRSKDEKEEEYKYIRKYNKSIKNHKVYLLESESYSE